MVVVVVVVVAVVWDGMYISREWDVAQLVEHRTVTPLSQVRFPGAAWDFLPKVNFLCRLSSPVFNRIY